MDQNNFPVPGTVLWGTDVQIDRDVFRRGASTKPNTDFLRYIDLKILDLEGRIDAEQAKVLVVRPGQGISLFLTRYVGDKFKVLNEEARKTVDKKLQQKVFWWTVDSGHPIPSGLVLKYDGNPPGHCTLTVERTMTVEAFLQLMVMVPFSPQGSDVIGPA